MEIGGIEIDPKPRTIDGFDDVEERVGLGDDASVILDAEKNPAIPGVFAAFLEGGDAILARRFGRLSKRRSRL